MQKIKDPTGTTPSHYHLTNLFGNIDVGPLPHLLSYLDPKSVIRLSASSKKLTDLIFHALKHCSKPTSISEDLGKHQSLLYRVSTFIGVNLFTSKTAQIFFKKINIGPLPNLLSYLDHKFVIRVSAGLKKLTDLIFNPLTHCLTSISEDSGTHLSLLYRVSKFKGINLFTSYSNKEIAQILNDLEPCKKEIIWNLIATYLCKKSINLNELVGKPDTPFYRGKDEDFLLVCIKINARNYLLADETMQTNRGFLMKAIKINHLVFQYAPRALQDDKQVALAAVSQNGGLLMYASEALKNDFDVVLAAVSQNGWALMYAHEDLKKNKEVVLAAVSQNGLALRYASKTLRNDFNVVLAAVSQNGEALLDASETLRNDWQVVVTAILQDGRALQYASQDLRNDFNVVLAAVSQNSFALQYASETLRDDFEVVLAAVSQNGEALRFASKTLRNDFDVVLTAVSKSGKDLMHASEALRNNFDVVLAAISQNGGALAYASEALQNNKEITNAAIVKLNWTPGSKWTSDSILLTKIDEILSRHHPEIVQRTLNLRLQKAIFCYLFFIGAVFLGMHLEILKMTKK